jgi:hypothetical protein
VVRDPTAYESDAVDAVTVASTHFKQVADDALRHVFGFDVESGEIIPPLLVEFVE